MTAAFDGRHNPIQTRAMKRIKPSGNPHHDLTEYFELMTSGLTPGEQYHLLVELDRYRNPHKYEEDDTDD